MTKRRDLPTSRRGDRPTLPHSRIPDAIYYEVLPHLNGNEVKLWLALKSREWRKDGSRKGLVRKSLNRVARDIGMARRSAQRAFAELRRKGFAEWAGQGIRLLEPDFTTAVTTPITTKGGRQNGAGGGANRRRSRRLYEPERGVIPFPNNELTHGRSDLTIRQPERAESARSAAVEDPEPPASPASGRARVCAQGSDARSGSGGDRKEANVQKPKRENDRDGNTDEGGELAVREMPRDEALAILKRIKARALAEAEKGTTKLRSSSEARRAREEERKAELRRQRAELEAQERNEA